MHVLVRAPVPILTLALLACRRDGAPSTTTHDAGIEAGLDAGDEAGALVPDPARRRRQLSAMFDVKMFEPLVAGGTASDPDVALRAIRPALRACYVDAMVAGEAGGDLVVTMSVASDGKPRDVRVVPDADATVPEPLGACFRAAFEGAVFVARPASVRGAVRMEVPLVLEVSDEIIAAQMRLFTGTAEPGDAGSQNVAPPPPARVAGRVREMTSSVPFPELGNVGRRIAGALASCAGAEGDAGATEPLVLGELAVTVTLGDAGAPSPAKVTPRNGGRVPPALLACLDRSLQRGALAAYVPPGASLKVVVGLVRGTSRI